MTEKLESGQNQGAPGQPTSGASNGEVSSPSIDVDAVLNALGSRLDEMIERRVQSMKDKRLGRMGQQLDEFESVLTRFQELINEGWSEAQAKRIMRLEASGRQEEASEPEVTQKPAEPGNSQPVAPQKKDVNPKVLGLDPKDPDVTRRIREGKTSLEDWYEYLEQRASRATSASPAAVQPTAEAPAPDDDLMAQYRKAVDEALKDPFAGRDKVIQIRAEYRRKGLKI